MKEENGRIPEVEITQLVMGRSPSAERYREREKKEWKASIPKRPRKKLREFDSPFWNTELVNTLAMASDRTRMTICWRIRDLVENEYVCIGKSNSAPVVEQVI